MSCATGFNLLDVKGSRTASGRPCTSRRSCTASDEGREARRYTVLDQLRANEMDVAVDTTCGQNHPFASDHFSGHSDDHPWCDAVHDVRVSGFPYAGNFAILVERDMH